VSVCLSVCVDIRLWSSSSSWWRDDWLCRYSLVSCSRDHVELDALQSDWWV